MATSLDQVNTERAVEYNQGAEVNGQDVEIAFRMAVQMLNEGGGMDVIRSAINESSDPAQVVGQFLAQLIGQLATELQGQINLDPRIFLAKDGWLDLILDYIEQQLGYPEEFSDQIYGEVLETIKAAAMSGQAPNNVMQEGGEQAMPNTPQQPATPNMPQAGGTA